MLVTFHCTKCQSELEGDAAMAGTEVKCPQCATVLTVPQQSLGPGLTIGGFEIIRMLGEGGMGEVYLARQLSLGRNVALKILPKQMKMRHGVAERFFKEVKLLARLEHANIVMAFEAGEDAGVMYLAMGYVNGESLEQKLRREGPMKEAEALQMIGKLAGALDYAWREHKLLHRDIKPSNVMLTAGSEVKLMDFGLAKCLQEDTALTLSGTIMGTPNYMSPEQVEGNVDPDCRADLYSLGATLYHMVTGKLPFAGSSVMETLRKQVNEALPDPRTINPAVSENCVTLLEIMLSKNRDKRHPDYKMLMADIALVMAGDPPMREPLQAGESVLIRANALGMSRAPKPATHRKAPAKSNRKLIIGAAAGVALVLGIGATLVMGLRAPRPETAKSDGAEKGNAVLPGPVNNQSSNQASTEAASVEAVKPRQDEVLAKLTRQYLEALTFSREHPEDYAGALVLLEPLGKDAAGTELEGKVNDEIGRMGRVRKQAVDKAITVLREDVQAKMAEGDFGGALKRIELDTGLVTEETKAARTELAGEVMAKKQAAEELKVKQAADTDQQKQAAAAKEKLAALAQGVATDLLKGDAAGMTRRMTAAQSDPALGIVSNEMSALNAMASQAINWPDCLAKTFAESKGKAVTVEFKDGRKEQFTVTGVAGGRIQGQKQMAAGFIGREFALADLSAEEKLKRLGDDPRPVMKVMRGLVMVKCANDWASAGKEFASAGGILAEALAKEAPGQQTPAAETAAAKPQEKPAVEKPVVEAKAAEAAPAKPNKPDAAKPVTRAPLKPEEEPAPVALKPATEETIKAALEKLEKANGGKLNAKYEINRDGITLKLNKNPKLRDLGALSGLPLVALELSWTDVKDLLPLVGMPLDKLVIRVAPVDNIKPLSKIKTLSTVNFIDTEITDLTPLKGLRLTRFLCVGKRKKGVRDLTPLEGMPLQFLGVNFSDATSPKEMAANIAVIQGMSCTRIGLTGSVIKDIKFVENLSSVNNLIISDTQVSDLSPLRGMKSLNMLRLERNPKVADIKALKGIDLILLEISSMDITSLEPLAEKGKNIATFDIFDCPKLTDTDKIPEYFPNLNSITIGKDFPNPGILMRCVNLQEIKLGGSMTPPITMAEFKKQFGKPAKQPDKKQPGNPPAAGK